MSHVLVEAQDFYAERSFERENQISVREGKKALFHVLGEIVEIGRELCVPPTLPTPGEPPPEMWALHNIMGQEDRFRIDPDTLARADNTQVGRVVWTTTRPSFGSIWYGPDFFGPVNEFVVPIEQATRFHEHFLPALNPNTLYVFFLQLNSTLGDFTESQWYWFETSGDIIVGVANMFVVANAQLIQMLEAVVEGLGIIDTAISFAGDDVAAEFFGDVDSDLLDLVTEETEFLSFETDVTIT